ncbi:MAG: rhomboid family intramembrane serine protease [Gemmatimonadaceae bacterium]
MTHLTPTIQRPRSLGAAIRTHATVLGASLTSVWAGFGADRIVGGALLPYGVQPRSLTGLRGVLLAPFLHANFAHLVSNTVPLVLLGWLVMWRDARHFIPVTLLAMLGAGLLPWLIGAPGSVHIGASGVVFGYLGFLILAGWFARSATAIALSLIVTAVWGGLVLGVLPGQPGISWEAHFGGFIGGALAAKWLAPRRS